jgi:hypothetical protein
MNEEDVDADILEDDPTLRLELEQLASTIRKRDWGLRVVELDRLVSRHGVVAIYDLGRIVGQLQLSESLDRSVRDGWDAEPALRSRAGSPMRKTGDP